MGIEDINSGDQPLSVNSRADLSLPQDGCHRVRPRPGLLPALPGGGLPDGSRRAAQLPDQDHRDRPVVQDRYESHGRPACLWRDGLAKRREPSRNAAGSAKQAGEPSRNAARAAKQAGEPMRCEERAAVRWAEPRYASISTANRHNPPVGGVLRL